MSSFSVDLNDKRECRYVFPTRLWNNKLIGNQIFEKIVALAVPFSGELKDHILLGANVTNNWKFTLSRMDNKLDVIEQFSEAAQKREHPYRYCFDNTGRVMALQEFTSINNS